MSGVAVPYTRIPDAILLDPRLTAVQLRVYAVIARRADRETGSAFPSYLTIAKDANVSRTSAINGVTALRSFGYLTKQSQQSGQGDLTSNRYTLSGEGSQIFVPRRPNTDGCTPEVVQNLDHPSTEFALQVVQPLDHGGANFVPELESTNQKQGNETQENRVAPAYTHDASAAAALDPKLQSLFNDFHENIGALTTVAKQVIAQLADEFSANWVHDAIREAVIYEKRSLAYVRRVLRAWKSAGRSAERASPGTVECPAVLDAAQQPSPSQSAADWPPPGLIDDLPMVSPGESPAVITWAAISKQIPQLGRYACAVTPVRLIDDVLTVTTPDSRIASIFGQTQRHILDVAVKNILGSSAAIRVEMAVQNTVAT